MSGNLKSWLGFMVAGAMLLGGCFAPRPLEFGQDKVREFPVAKASERETQRQAAQRASRKADETLLAALQEGSSSAVMIPAKETGLLTEAISVSLGPPLNPAAPTVSSEDLARRLETATAKFNSRVEDFKEDNNENAGKKIEGTGLFQIGYMSYLAIMAVVLFVGVILFKVGSMALKAYSLSNPAVAVGLNAVQAGGALASKALGQVLTAGESFKADLKTKVPGLTDELAAAVLAHFRTTHERKQDQDVQSVIRQLTQK
jgi:hypothetical protein